MNGGPYFAEKYESKLVIRNVESCSLSSGMEPHHLAVYIPASGGQPALVQLKRFARAAIICKNSSYI